MENVVWMPGYWRWSEFGYYWVPGTWVEPPTVGLLWTPGYWGWGDGNFAWHEGYWGEHVGFYGGVNYGGGYGGEGFHGGGWHDGRYVPNRSVINVPNITNVTNVSFNGGPGGNSARPTSQEQAVARERHVPPTSEQMKHREAAGSNPQLRESANHGKPEIAATAKPAEFSGKGVVAARQAGVQNPKAQEHNQSVIKNPALAKGAALPKSEGREEPKAPATQARPDVAPRAAEERAKPAEEMAKPVPQERAIEPRPQVERKLEPEERPKVEAQPRSEEKPKAEPQPRPAEPKAPPPHQEEKAAPKEEHPAPKEEKPAEEHKEHE